eukprot:1591467-Pleurochrysis_carterae.AAC.1
MMRPLRSRPTTLRGLRSPHLPTRREWTAAARPPPPRSCKPLSRQKNDERDAHSIRQRCTPLSPLVPAPALHTLLRCLRALTARPHGASEHALHWPQGGKPPGNATGGSDVLNPSPPTLTPTP